MRLSKALLCAALICALSLSTLAEEGANTEGEATPAPITQAPTNAVVATNAPAANTPAPEASASVSPTDIQHPSPSTTDESTQAPTNAPSTQPTQSTSPSPTAQPEQSPSSQPNDDPTTPPSTEPSLEPSSEPSLEPSEEPSNAPSPEPTLEPSATPRPIPGEDGGLISISVEGNVQFNGDVWKIALQDPSAAIAFTWSCAETASNYLLYSADASGNARFISQTQSQRAELSAADYANGRFTFHVGAVLLDGSISWGSLCFELETFAQFPGGFGGFGGGRPSGGGNFGAMPEEEAGFRVTPGEALSSSHASGTKNSTAYTCSELPTSTKALNVLSLSSTQTQILLDNGESTFYASNADGTLTLTPESTGEEWQLSVLALNTLADSGVDEVIFQTGSASTVLPTRIQFSGSVYAALRAQGGASKDLKLIISAQGVTVRVEEMNYSINEENELIPLGAYAQ